MKIYCLLTLLLLQTACSDKSIPVDATQQASESILQLASEAELKAYIEAGLEQWSGLAESSVLLESKQRSTFPMIGKMTLDAGLTMSGTNIIVEGVDEIDVVRYDGENIYIANNDHIQVVKTGALGTAEIVSNLRVTGQSTYSKGLYHYQLGGISLLANIRSNNQYYRGSPVASYWRLLANPFLNELTSLDLIDVENPSNASLLEQLSIDGRYINSRRIGNIVYLVTQHPLAIEGLIPFAKTEENKLNNRMLIEKFNINELMPMIHFNDGSKMPLVTSSECYMPKINASEHIYSLTMTTITAFDISSPNNYSSICTFEGVQGIHASKEAIYLAAGNVSLAAELVYTQETSIHKFGIANGMPQYRGSGRIQGLFLDDPTFLMGEHNGNLTVITTFIEDGSLWGDWSHHLSILADSSGDFTLELLGQVPNNTRTESIGKPGERIFASRILSDRAFVVTYNQIDPVYLIDLATPSDPFIAAELEIPGFSTYLHPISDNLLLGLGKDALPDGRIQGANLRLFDISNPASLGVLAEIKVGKRDTDSAGLRDHHAFTVSKIGDTHRIAIPFKVYGDHLVNKNDNSYYPWTENALHLFEVNETTGALVDVGKVVAENHATGERGRLSCCTWNDRSFIQGDTIHYLNKTRLFSTSWLSPEITSNIFIPTLFVNDQQAPIPRLAGDVLRLRLFDRDTGAGIYCANVLAVSGQFSSSLNSYCPNDMGIVPFEQAGTFRIEASADGYQPISIEDLRIQSDQNGAEQTSLNLYLTPL